MRGRDLPKEQRIRDLLLQRATRGEISGEDADREAIAAGLEPFSTQPDPSLFDPEREAFWTMAMSVAWIAFRTNDAVRNSWHKYCAECWYWIWQRWRNGPDGEVQEGWQLEQRRRPTLVRLSIAAAFYDANGTEGSMLSPREAEEALWIALQEGLFEASGIDLETGKRVAIPALEWHELRPIEGRGEVDEVRRGPLGTGYRDMLFPSRAIRGIWRAPRQKPAKLPRLVPPEGDGYMTLYCAAQWIATKGGTTVFDPEDQENWRPAYSALLDAIASDRVRVVGTRDGDREQVPGFHFAGCEVDYPFADASLEMMSGEQLYLCSYPFVDEEHWRRGFDDTLRNRRVVRWTRLMVAKEDIRERWPFELPRPERSGAPGRPTSMHLVLEELGRRGLVNELQSSIRAEAAALATWLSATHPAAPSLTAKTIANKIGPRFRALKAGN